MYYFYILWQYRKKTEFTAYFTNQVRIPSPKGTPRFETLPGQQAQIDWKESIPFKTSDGEKVEVNVGALLGYSRFRIFTLTFRKSQDVLFSFLTEAFEKIGGLPKEFITDNLKTIMDEARTVSRSVDLK